VYFILTEFPIHLLPNSALYQDISQYEIITDVADLNKETTKIKLLLQKTVNKLDVEAHTVELDDGSVIEYNKVMGGWVMTKSVCS
jgi:NADH dehydrogenase FAD-containing subunit